MENLFETIHEDPELLVINKPAGLACHPTKGDAYSSLISRIRLYLADKEVRPHLINRLDRETSGVVMVAKNDAAALELRRIWEQRDVTKSYLAIVHGHVNRDGVIDAPLGRDEANIVAIKDKVRPDGAAASTEYEVRRRFTRPEGDFSLLRVRPFTGRKHQIRIHLAYIGHSIVGDKLYGLDARMYLDFVKGQLTDEQRRKLILPHQALHAQEVLFAWRGGNVSFRAEPESWFINFASAAAI